MIQTENLKTTVKFGLGQKGSIGVGASRMKLTLQMLASDICIGEDFGKDDVHELPKIEMEFFNPKSLDVLIKALEVIKKDYYDNYGFALAC